MMLNTHVIKEGTKDQFIIIETGDIELTEEDIKQISGFMLPSISKLPHELALNKIKNKLQDAGYTVKWVRESYDEGEQGKTPETLAFYNYLDIELPGYKSVKIMAAYECLDTNTWTYSETTLEYIIISAWKALKSNVDVDVKKLGPEEFSRFKNDYAKIIDLIKGLGFTVRLHLTYSVDVYVGSRLDHVQSGSYNSPV